MPWRQGVMELSKHCQDANVAEEKNTDTEMTICMFVIEKQALKSGELLPKGAEYQAPRAEARRVWGS